MADSVFDKVKEGIDKTGFTALSAALDLGKEAIVTGAHIVTKPLRMVGGVGDAGGNLVKGTWNAAGNVLKKTNNIAEGALRNPVTKPLLMIAAAVAVYKGIKGYFSRKEKTHEIEVKSERADAINAQSAQMLDEYQKAKEAVYRFENPNAKSGHVDRYMAEGAQGHAQTR